MLLPSHAHDCVVWSNACISGRRACLCAQGFGQRFIGGLYCWLILVVEINHADAIPIYAACFAQDAGGCGWSLLRPFRAFVDIAVQETTWRIRAAARILINADENLCLSCWTGVLSSVVVAPDALPFALNVSVAVPDNRAALCGEADWRCCPSLP